jgi:hypothetical protein
VSEKGSLCESIDITPFFARLFIVCVIDLPGNFSFKAVMDPVAPLDERKAIISLAREPEILLSQL